MAAAKKPPTIVETIDKALILVSCTGAAERGSVQDTVGVALAKKLLECRELGETLEGILKPGDDSR